MKFLLLFLFLFSCLREENVSKTPHTKALKASEPINFNTFQLPNDRFKRLRDGEFKLKDNTPYGLISRSKNGHIVFFN